MAAASGTVGVSSAPALASQMPLIAQQFGSTMTVTSFSWGRKQMASFQRLLGSDYVKVKLSLLWLFVTLNYIYADILSLMDASVLNEILTGAVGENVEITPTFLFFGAILMEIPIAMVVLSLILKRPINRWANIIAGAIKTLAVAGSLFVGVPALYYLFFGVIEILTTLYIMWLAWTWQGNDAADVA